MNFPANYIHAIVAIPLFITFSAVSIRSYMKTKNMVTFYLGIAAACYVITLSFPIILSTNSNVLTIGMMIGASFELIAGIILWILVARLYAPKADFIRGAIISLSIVAAVIAGFLAFRDLMRVPVTMIEDGGVQILYSPVSREYITMLALQYVSFFFLSIAFWRQSRTVTTARDKMRLRILSVMFAVVFIVLGLLPFSSSGSDGVLSVAQSLQLAAGLSLLGVFMVITFFIRPDKKA
ncbi:MAG: hypothetical protein QG658_478 [Patescibacteria group bacterium]|nr:hypothetical protein [Patescibacteria group bacterium]